MKAQSVFYISQYRLLQHTPNFVMQDFSRVIGLGSTEMKQENPENQLRKHTRFHRDKWKSYKEDCLFCKECF